MKPIIYVSIDANGGIAAMQVAHPTSPPADGLAWITYAAASTNLAGALKDNEKLFCQKELTRRMLDDSTLEHVTRHQRRKYCDRQCIAALKKTGVVTSPTYLSDFVPFPEMARSLWSAPV